MKSVSERKKEKELREQKKRMKRSPGASGRYRRFGIPTYGIGYLPSEGDLAFLKKKATKLLKDCKNLAPRQFYKYIKDIILEEERLAKEEREKRDEIWNQRIARANSNTAITPTPIATLPTIAPTIVPTIPAPVTVSENSTTPAVVEPTAEVEEESPDNWSNADWIGASGWNFNNIVLGQRNTSRRRRN